MSKIKFALVGCGRIVKKHLEALQEMEEAELVAVCDLDIEKARMAAEFAKVDKYYTSYDEMLQNVDIDVVTILTPSGMHPKHTVDIVKKYKKHKKCLFLK